MAGFAPSYQDYLKQYQANGQSAFSESGASNQLPQISEEDWNKLSPDNQWSEYMGADQRATTNLPGANMARSLYVGSDDPRYADLAKQAGVTDGRGIEVLYGAPSHMGDNTWWRDPNAVKDLGNGVYATPENNFTQHAYEESNKGDTGFNIVRALSTAAMLYGGAEAAGLVGGGADAGGAAGSTAGISSTDAAESGGTLALDTAGTGTTPYVGATAVDTAGTTAGTGLVDDPGFTAPEATGYGGAPVADNSVDATGAFNVGGDSSGGLISGAQTTTPSSTGFNLPDWYKNASPVTRMVIGQAISAGARGMLQGIAQRNAQNFAREQQQQQIDQWNQSHRVGAFSDSAFTPKTPGIISGANGG